MSYYRRPGALLRRPGNRAWITGVVSLRQAARPLAAVDRLAEQFDARGKPAHCHWCGGSYPPGYGPEAGYCTQVCVDASGVHDEEESVA